MRRGCDNNNRTPKNAGELQNNIIMIVNCRGHGRHPMSTVLLEPQSVPRPSPTRSSSSKSTSSSGGWRGASSTKTIKTGQRQLPTPALALAPVRGALWGSGARGGSWIGSSSNCSAKKQRQPGKASFNSVCEHTHTYTHTKTATCARYCYCFCPETPRKAHGAGCVHFEHCQSCNALRNCNPRNKTKKKNKNTVGEMRKSACNFFLLLPESETLHHRKT